MDCTVTGEDYKQKKILSDKFKVKFFDEQEHIGSVFGYQIFKFVENFKKYFTQSNRNQVSARVLNRVQKLRKGIKVALNVISEEELAKVQAISAEMGICLPTSPIESEEKLEESREKESEESYHPTPYVNAQIEKYNAESPASGRGVRKMSKNSFKEKLDYIIQDNIPT